MAGLWSGRVIHVFGRSGLRRSRSGGQGKAQAGALHRGGEVGRWRAVGDQVGQQVQCGDAFQMRLAELAGIDQQRPPRGAVQHGALDPGGAALGIAWPFRRQAGGADQRHVGIEAVQEVDRLGAIDGAFGGIEFPGAEQHAHRRRGRQRLGHRQAIGDDGALPFPRRQRAGGMGGGGAGIDHQHRAIGHQRGGGGADAAAFGHRHAVPLRHRRLQPGMHHGSAAIGAAHLAGAGQFLDIPPHGFGGDVEGGRQGGNAHRRVLRQGGQDAAVAHLLAGGVGAAGRHGGSLAWPPPCRHGRSAWPAGGRGGAACPLLRPRGMRVGGPDSARPAGG